VHAALAVFAEFELTRKQDVRVVGLMNLDAIGVRLAREPCQFRLGVEQVHLAGSAVLHELNDGFGLRRKMRTPGLEVAMYGGRGTEKIGEYDAAETKTGSFQQSTAGKTAYREGCVVSLCHGASSHLTPNRIEFAWDESARMRDWKVFFASFSSRRPSAIAVQPGCCALGRCRLSFGW